ncbi:MAG: hypothetical protein KDN19_06075 [Verrucomicrobiae bacterium]|nr:hypothetical protein [Verrucomicrobiae bacterium]
MSQRFPHILCFASLFLSVVNSARADVVADFRSDLGLVTQNAPAAGEEIDEWIDQSATPMANLLKSGSVKISNQTTPNGGLAMQFEHVGVSNRGYFEDQAGSPLDGATEFSVAVLFRPISNGGVPATSENGLRVASLVSHISALPADGWGLGYRDNEVWFSIADSGDADNIETLKVGPGSSMVGKWWIAIASWKADDGTGNPVFCLSLFNERGDRVGTRQSRDPNPTPGDGLYANARESGGFRIGQSHHTPGAFLYNGNLGRVQFHDTALEEDEEEDVALQMVVDQNAALFTVTDDGDTGAGTLREALTQANSNGIHSIIVFDPGLDGSTLFLTSGEIWITQETTLFGGAYVGGIFTPFANPLPLDGGNSQRIFRTASFVDEVRLENLRFTNGNHFSSGGAIWNQSGYLTTRDCVFDSNTAPEGGAIHNDGATLTVENCRFEDNESDEGGAISNEAGVAVIEDSLFEANEGTNDTFGGHGGAIYSEGTNFLNDTLTIRRTTFRNNHGADSNTSGGSGGNGGAIFARQNTVTISECLFTGNRAGDGQGGSGIDGGVGGALFLRNDTATMIERTTFTGNRSGLPSDGSGDPGIGGAIRVINPQGLTIVNSTFYDNETGSDSHGGALSIEYAGIEEIILRHSTFAGNRGASALFSETTSPSPTNIPILENSIVTDNRTFDDQANGIDVSGDFELEGNNLILNSPGATFSGSGSAIAQSADLGTFQDNGGFAFTLKPNPSSPANDGATTSANTPATDQREVARPIGGAPDIGAVEVPPEIAVTTVGTQERRGDMPFTIQLSVTLPDSLSISASTSDGTAEAGIDYAATSETIVIPAGQRTGVFRVKIFDDALPEENETIHASFTSSDPGTAPMTTPMVTGTIFDDSGDDGVLSFPEEPLDVGGFHDIDTPGPVANLAGRYSGLVHTSPTANSFLGSLVSLTLRPNGSFSAVFEWKGERFVVRGAFDELTASFSTTLNLKSGPEVTVSLGVGQTAGGHPKITGSISETGGDTGAIFAEAASFNRANQTDKDGRYTMLIPIEESDRGDSLVPQGDGCASVLITPTGVIRMVGSLGDGTRFAQSSFLRGDLQWSFWKSLYRTRPQRGYLAGVITIRDTAGVSDFDGVLQWKKFPDPREVRYKDGFDLAVHAIGSVFMPPAPGDRALSTLADQDYNARIIFSESLLPDGDLAKVLNWDARNRLGNFGPERIRGGVNRRTGLINGNYRYESTRFAFKSAVFQKQELAAGSFVFGVRSGHVLLEPGTGFDYPGSDPGLGARDLQVFSGIYILSGFRENFSEDYAGNYSGNIQDAMGPVGFFRSLNIRPDGTFTASIEENGERFVVRGMLDATGEFDDTVFTRSGREMRVILRTHDNLGFKRIEGSVAENGQPMQSIILGRQDFHARKNPTPRAGRYTMILPEIVDSNFPQGAGYATFNVAANGRITMLAVLGDRTRFSHSTFLSGEEFWSVYVTLYRRSPDPGKFAGQLKMTPGVEDFDGWFDWQKNPDPNDPFFPAGFTVPDQTFEAARYNAPAPGERAMDGLVDTLYNSRLILEKNLPGGDIKKILRWDERNRIAHDGRARIPIRFNPRTGLVSGSFFENGVRTNFSGVLLQLINADDLIKGSHVIRGNKPGAMTIEQW